MLAMDCVWNHRMKIAPQSPRVLACLLAYRKSSSSEIGEKMVLVLLSSEKESLTELMRGQEQVMDGLKSMNQNEINGLITAIQAQCHDSNSASPERSLEASKPSSSLLNEQSPPPPLIRNEAFPFLKSQGCGNAHELEINNNDDGFLPWFFF